MPSKVSTGEGKRKSSDTNTDDIISKKQKICGMDESSSSIQNSVDTTAASGLVYSSTNRVSKILKQTLCENNTSFQNDDRLSDSTKQSAYKYVIIGAGNAAGYAAKAFVDSGKLLKRELCIIGTEPVLPYERPALSKGYMLGKAKLPRFNTCAFFKQPNNKDWYDKHGIVMMVNTTVSDIDVKAKVIQTEDGKEIRYEKCLAATGARPTYLTDFNVPGSDMEGLFYLRSHSDAEALLNRLNEAQKNEKVVMVGGGYIGMEMASAILHNGLTNITMVFPEECVIEKILPLDIAEVYERALISKGVKLMKNGKMVTGFEAKAKNRRIDTVCLNDGQKLHADIVVVGIGARANVELFANKVDMDKQGIKVNGMMQSSVQDLYACGDVATFPIICHGETNRLEHVRAARTTSMHAARSMMGIAQKDIDFLPVFYSRFLNFKWEMAGKRTQNILFFGLRPKAGSIFGCVWLTNDNRLCGVFLEGGNNEDKDHIAVIARKQEVLPTNLLKPEASALLMTYVLA